MFNFDNFVFNKTFNKKFKKNINSPTIPLSKVVCYRCNQVGHYAQACANKQIKDFKNVILPLRNKIEKLMENYKKILREMTKEVKETLPLCRKEKFNELITQLVNYLQAAAHEYKEATAETNALKEEYNKLKMEILSGEREIKAIQNRSISYQLINKRNDEEIKKLKKALSDSELEIKKLKRYNNNNKVEKKIYTFKTFEELYKKNNYSDEEMQEIFKVDTKCLNQRMRLKLAQVRTKMRNQLDGVEDKDDKNLDPILENFFAQEKKKKVQKEKTEWSRLDNLRKQQEKEKEKRIKEEERKKNEEKRLQLLKEKNEIEKQKQKDIQEFNKKKIEDYEKKQKEVKKNIRRKEMARAARERFNQTMPEKRRIKEVRKYKEQEEEDTQEYLEDYNEMAPDKEDVE